MRIAPSWAVTPAPNVAASPMPATMGAEMRTLICRQEAGQRLDADIAQRAVPLHGEHTAGRQGQEPDDHDGSAYHGQCACAH
jgi:hypothetical protein